MRLIRRVLGFLYIVIWYALPPFLLIEFIVGGLGIPWISVSLILTELLLFWFVRDADGEFLFHPKNASRSGSFRYFSFKLLRRLDQAGNDAGKME